MLIILIVLIILVLIWWAVLKSKRKDIPLPVQWPPEDYMAELGGKCPDYWTYLGDHDNKNICQNTLNIKTNHNNCHNLSTADGDMQLTEFTKYKKWPPTGNALDERCKWIKQCGSVGNIDATWIGMDKICTNSE